MERVDIHAIIQYGKGAIFRILKAGAIFVVDIYVNN
jgi:hypothetical protein